MRLTQRFLGMLLLSALSVVALGSLGCAGRSRVRVYDSYHNDYHRWNNHETVYYNRWEVEGHRDHRDYNQRNADEQRDYWNWRHDHH
jgi:hypothetical protein